MTSAYTINLNPNITTPVKTGYTFKAGDKGITFNIVVNEMDDATGMTAKICFMRANGASVEATLTGTGPTFSYTTLGNEFAVPGVVVADVKFYNSTTQRYSTASFVFNVIGDTLDGLGGDTGPYSDQLEELSAEFEDTLHEYQDAFGEVGAVVPKGQYNASTAYTALDLVEYNGQSWLCRQGCTGQTPSQSSQYWQLFATGPNSAANVTYDNTSSGLVSNNVQNSIDEIAPLAKETTISIQECDTLKKIFDAFNAAGMAQGAKVRGEGGIGTRQASDPLTLLLGSPGNGAWVSALVRPFDVLETNNGVDLLEVYAVNITAKQPIKRKFLWRSQSYYSQSDWETINYIS